MIRQIVLLLLVSVMLSACSEQSDRFSTYTVGQQQIGNINNLLSTQLDNGGKTYWPFSEAYLQARHLAYQGLANVELSDSQQAQLNYLIIAQRYPERFFVWPVQRDVISNAIKQDDYTPEALGKWIERVETKLIEAEQSNLRLNKLELKLLRSMVISHLDNNNENVVMALTKLNQYLAQYKPRTKLGLVGLANGKDWYQSKLNYFANTTKPPLSWLSEIQHLLKEKPTVDLSLPVFSSHNKPLVLQYLEDGDLHAGLDWQLDFIDVKQSKRQLNQDEQYFWSVMMETDLGIHYHTWNEQQARVNLMKRLSVNQQQADWLIEDIVLYPAMSFIFAR